MFKKKIFNKLTLKYHEHAYTGLMGYFMKRCHQQLEKIKFENNISKVLEIGAGTEPHLKYIKHNFDEYHILETSENETITNFNDPKIKVKIYDGKKIPFEDNFFDRIIISHCLEHILEPEKFLYEMMSKLKRGGVLSISLPNDPALLFRLGRFYLKLFSIKKKYQITNDEFDYMNATEHVNSIFALHAIIKHNFNGSSIQETYLPFRIKSFDLNLFYNVHITK